MKITKKDLTEDEGFGVNESNFRHKSNLDSVDRFSCLTLYTVALRDAENY